ncbi:glycosyltransferase family 2 protein [Paenibacillus sp. IB182496]|uniref:Glycosyltransferase family 2 protein n=1 Tax=Paenibacillus sabuli TaxID=2772509 RepID=A0A927GRR2_9BACL|nr:glycosyltransferase family A protein [Paenibacillus sabuli]MBD2845924.1 glycosyltransferase family 2 protein [Paenibacillus sabuli]
MSKVFKATSESVIENFQRKNFEIEQNTKLLEEALREQAALETEYLKLSKNLKVQIRKNNHNKRLKEKHKRKYSEIERSRTWRYTRFLRYLGSVYKKGFRKVNHSVQSEKFINESVALKKDLQRVERIKQKLFNLGFTERALEELNNIILKNDTQLNTQKNIAAWVLALWYANMRTNENAKKCLEMLSIVKENPKGIEIDRVCILEAECYILLGEIEKGKEILMKFVNKPGHIDYYLAISNTENKLSDKLNWINKGLQNYGINDIFICSNSSLKPYDRLYCEEFNTVKDNIQPKVSVIMPVYNAEHTVETAIKSILNQSWSNLELIIVDDCSNDNSLELVKKLAVKDHRIKILQNEQNAGPYVCRNMGIEISEGEFITCNDSDDWSHAQKIEFQVLHLINNPNVMGNTSQQVRATSDMEFYRRGNLRLVFTNISSFMFRKKPVLNKVGYLDEVRFGADSEYIRRVRKIFGKNSVADLSTGPLSFQRQSSTSLTGNSAFGYHGFLMGARQEYFESQSFYHQNATSLFYERNGNERPFPVPEPMLPNRIKSENELRKFDVIIISDFRKLTGNERELLELIKLSIDNNLKTGIIQMSLYEINPTYKMYDEIRSIIDGQNIQKVVYGEKVTSDKIIIFDSRVLIDYQKYVPSVKSKEVLVTIKNTRKDVIEKIEIMKKHLDFYFQCIDVTTWLPEEKDSISEGVAGTEINLLMEEWDYQYLFEHTKKIGYL